MSGQSESFSQRRAPIDPINLVGVALLLFALVAGVRGIISGPQTGATPTATPLVALAAVTSTPLASPTLLVLPTPTPEAIGIRPNAAVTRIRVTATPSPAPSPTPTPLPSATPTVVQSPTPIVIFVNSPTPLPDALVPNVLTLLPPTPTPLPTPDGPNGGIGLPILMYHYVSEPPAGADKYRVDLSVSPANLRRQLEYLQANGYTTIDFYDLARALANRQTLPEKPVILTFDDGYRDNYENAFPLLQAFGMKAVFFVISEPANFNDPRYMTWEMVREMSDAGMSMEIHTVSHPDLSQLDDDEARAQIAVAQAEIAAATGKLPRFLAYPGGNYDEDTVRIARELDLWGAVTTQYGTFHQRANRYEWKRVRMRYTTTLNEFASLLTVFVPQPDE